MFFSVELGSNVAFHRNYRSVAFPLGDICYTQLLLVTLLQTRVANRTPKTLQYPE